MEKIGFIIGQTFLYWSPLILTFAAVCTVCMFLGLQLGTGEKALGALLTVLLGLMFSLVLGRIVHWYCRPDSYESLLAAITDYSAGGYALAGVFAGCLLAAGILRLTGAVDNLPKTLDCMAISGALGMCVGRMNHLFNGFDRGMVVEGIRSMPLVYPVENPVSGELEYRLATFMLQAVVAGVLFAALTAFYLVGKARKTLRDGDACLVFLLCHGASQILLDSTRYDSLFLRSNGFVSLVQILGAACVVFAAVCFFVRLLRVSRWKWWYAPLGLSLVGMLTGAGIMEYYVQRISIRAAQFYHFMTAFLVGAVILTLVVRRLAVSAERREAQQNRLMQKESEQVS